jgi:glutamate N-acetyltransferase/amino-acid N-acetyltransferase
MTVNLKNLLNPNKKISKMGDFQELERIEGLSISAVSADLYGDGRDDLSLFYFKDGAKFAALYTKSNIVSESINWNLKLKNKITKALLVNTKNANTFTGKQGFQGLKELSRSLSKHLTLKLAQAPKGIRDVIDPNEIIFASTGVIGDTFPTEKIKERIPYLVQNLKDNQNKYVWFKAASSILTTDTRPKLAFEECEIGSKKILISAIAKGSGMIAPKLRGDHATMLAFLFTDANIPSSILRGLLSKNINTTFNAITVDGDTSTNDSVMIFATSKVKNSKIYNVLDPKLKGFEKALHNVMLNLSKQIVTDGEGAKKFITINVIKARSTQVAKKIAFSVANSPLVKTAVAGEDPNYGRIIMAIGKSEESIVANNLTIKFGKFTVVENGQQIDNYNEKIVKEYMKWDAIEINIELNMGKSNFTVYTCDFTKDYIDINTDYRN